MGKRHGKDTEITVDDVDLTTFVKTSQLTRSPDSHDVTTYGNTAHRYQTGLRDGKFTMGGDYDDSATGPAATLKPIELAGLAVVIVRKPVGTGAGLPVETFSAILTQYEESNPAADMIAWTSEWQIDGPIVDSVGV